MLMVFLIHRARQSLQEVQDRQFSAYRMQSESVYVPKLYSAVLDFFVRAPAVVSQVHIATQERLVSEPLPLIYQNTEVDQRAVLTKWGSALQNVPQMLRRLTWSISNFELFATPKPTRWVNFNLIIFFGAN